WRVRHEDSLAARCPAVRRARARAGAGLPRVRTCRARQQRLGLLRDDDDAADCAAGISRRPRVLDPSPQPSAGRRGCRPRLRDHCRASRPAETLDPPGFSRAADADVRRLLVPPVPTQAGLREPQRQRAGGVLRRGHSDTFLSRAPIGTLPVREWIETYASGPWFAL